MATSRVTRKPAMSDSDFMAKYNSLKIKGMSNQQVAASMGRSLPYIYTKLSKIRQNGGIKPASTVDTTTIVEEIEQKLNPKKINSKKLLTAFENDDDNARTIVICAINYLCHVAGSEDGKKLLETRYGMQLTEAMDSLNQNV